MRGSETHILTGRGRRRDRRAGARTARATSPRSRKRTQRSQPPLLYDLTALQREAASWHGFTARRTLSAAQGCYEKAVLTYPRTASRYLSTDMIPELKEIAGHVGARSRSTRKGAAYVQSLPELPLGRIVNDEKVTDHHAIIPTNAPHDGIELTPDERRIYDMVARRFLAAFHPQAVFENTTVLTEVAGESFRSRGKVMLEAGWRAVYGEAPPDEQKAQGAEGDEDERAGAGRFRRWRRARPCAARRSPPTRARPSRPPRYGEAALLAAMEGAGKLVEDDELREAMKDSGIGTPGHPRVDHRAPDRRRLHRARRPAAAADRQGHPGHRPAGRARAHESEPDRRLGAPPARYRARGRQPRRVHARHRDVHREARSRTCATCRPRRCASSGASSTSSARAAARAT